MKKLQVYKGDDVLKTNAYTLRITLAALSLLLLFAELSSASQTYKVRRGDTLGHIARRFGTTVSALQSANNLSGNYASRGLTLTIPSSSSISTSGPRVMARGRVLTDGLEVVSGDSVVARYHKNSSLGVVGREGSRLKVKLSDGTIGWVDGDSVKLEEIDRPIKAADSYSRTERVINTALSYRGARYRRGGDSRSGFDCSGFVKHVFSTLGINLPHSSSAQFGHGSPVSKDQLQKGDVLFFAGTYRRGVSHVGLYIGDGKFVHASTAREGVRVDCLDADYYRRHYCGARRMN